METGPYLSVLSLDFMKMLPGSFLKPLRLQLGNYRFPAGVLSRKSSSNMSHCRDFINIIRDIVLGACLLKKADSPQDLCCKFRYHLIHGTVSLKIFG